MKISAETRYPDFIRKVEESAVNAEVTIELAAGLNITSIVTYEAARPRGSPGRARVRRHQGLRFDG